MKINISAILSALAIVTSTSVFAGGDHGAHMNTTGGQKVMESMQMTLGEVKKIDLKNGKITLRHGEIKSLQMPPMTMVFTAKDASQLNGINKGDEVMFLVDNNMTLTHIEKK